MRLVCIFVLLVTIILLGCEGVSTQQKMLNFSYVHNKKESSKDSHRSNHLYVLKGNKVKHSLQYTGRRKKNETKSYTLSGQDIKDIMAYFEKNNFYQNANAKGKIKVSPGVFHSIELQITKDNQTYKLAYAGGFKFGERPKKRNKIHQQLLKFESFLRRKLRK